jgi:hypothetical protein
MTTKDVMTPGAMDEVHSNLLSTLRLLKKDENILWTGEISNQEPSVCCLHCTADGTIENW